MSQRLAPVFLNTNDSDATPRTGWGRTRMRA